MFCKQCGTQLQDGAAFCPQCGTAVTQEASFVQNPTSVYTPDTGVTTPVAQPKKVWKIFSKLSKIFSIISLVCLGISVLLLCTGNFIAAAVAYIFVICVFCLTVPAFVFSILVKKCDKTHQLKSHFGLALTTLIINGVLFFVSIGVFAALAVSASSDLPFRDPYTGYDDLFDFDF